MNEQLKKRIQSLAWRAGGMATIIILNGVLTMMSDGTIDVPQPYVILGGLLVGELTKYLNSGTVER